MAKIEKAVSDSGPLIHLAQINSINLFSIVKKTYIPDEVFNETCAHDLPGSRQIKSSKIINVLQLDKTCKDLAKIISERYSLGIGESQSIALARQEGISLLFTDDLSARTVAKAYGLEVHGSIGIVLRAFRKNIIQKQKAIQTVIDLKGKSSLFITSDIVNDIVNYIIKEIEKSSKRKS